MSNENISFDDFAEAFDSEGGYQTDSADDTYAEEDMTIGDDDAETVDAEETAPEDAEQTSQEDPAEQEDAVPPEKEQAKPDAETFTLKVNKEEKTYSREEVISLAQKGADYDRVKEQLEKSRQSAEELQGKLDSQAEAMEVLVELAKESKVDLPQMLDTLRLSILHNQGLSEEAARERLARNKAEKENAALKAAKAAEKEPAAETGAQRAQREIQEFRDAYPDVEITQELVDKLMGDVQGGMSLKNAYQKMESAQKDAKIAELEAQIAAEKQNKANRAASPGSQKDSGGRRTKSDFNDFMEAFG